MKRVLEPQAYVAVTLGFASAIVLSILFIDQPLSLWIHMNALGAKPFFESYMHALEIMFGYDIHPYFLTGVLVVAAAGIAIAKRSWAHPAVIALVYVCATHAATRFLVNVLKEIVSRPRPFQAIEKMAQSGTEIQNIFFEMGFRSFPSGHTGFFFSLFIPLMILMPRVRAWVWILPASVGIARIMVTDHYLADVLMSVWLSYTFSFMLAWIFSRATPFSIGDGITKKNIDIESQMSIKE